MESRFGRRELIIFEHVQALLSLSAGKQHNVSSLRKVQDSLLAHTRSLEGLGVNGDQYGVLLTPIVLSCLPSDIRMEWARGSEGKENDLEFLMTFLDRELKLRETSQTFKISRHESEKTRRPEKKSSATSLASARSVPSSGAVASAQPVCSLCSKGHHTDKCWELSRSSVDDRWKKVKSHGLCYKCLKKGHLSRRCRQLCLNCGGAHHLLLCPQRTQHDEQAAAPVPVVLEEEPVVVSHTGVCSLASNQSNSDVVMQVLKLEVRGRSGIVEANVLFDSGSDRSYVTSDLVSQVDPEFCLMERVAFSSFGSHTASKDEMRNIYNLELRGASFGCGVISATEVPVVCAPLFRRSVPDDILKQFGKVQLVEDYKESQHVKIDILIGLDHYWRFVRPDCVQVAGHSGLVAQKTVFGWILSGTYGKQDPDFRMSHPLLSVQKRDRDRAEGKSVVLPSPGLVESSSSCTLQLILWFVSMVLLFGLMCNFSVRLMASVFDQFVTVDFHSWTVVWVQELYGICPETGGIIPLSLYPWWGG